MKRLLPVLLVTAATLTVGCAQTPPQITVDNTPLEAPTRIIADITPQEAFDLIQSNKNNPDFVIIDVRTQAEFDSGHIENAINIDYNPETFRDELNNLDKNKTYLVYCAGGWHSADAVATMKKLNFLTVYNMLGGINRWQAEGLQTVK